MYLIYIYQHNQGLSNYEVLQDPVTFLEVLKDVLLEQGPSDPYPGLL